MGAVAATDKIKVCNRARGALLQVWIPLFCKEL